MLATGFQIKRITNVLKFKRAFSVHSFDGLCMVLPKHIERVEYQHEKLAGSGD